MNVYLDTNIFLIFVEEDMSNCEIILRAKEFVEKVLGMEGFDTENGI